MNKPQPQTGPEIEEYSTTATPKAYAGSVPVFCAHDAIVPLKDLRPNPKNPNQHPPEQIKLLASIIRATGWRAPITVSKRSGLVTKGHGRLMAAQLDDLTDAPVDYQDYASEAEELADLTADNRIAELATTDNKMLAEVFADIDTGEIPFMLSGYTEEEYGNLVTALSEALHDDESEKEDGDTEPEAPPEEPFTEPGDLWLLGDHRLYCGDSLKMGDVQKATDGQRADLVFTDPPYGMGKESDGVQNDNQNQNDLLEFNKKWIALSFSILKENGSWYCWGIDEPLMDIYAFILRPMIAANQITLRTTSHGRSTQPSASTASSCGATRGKPRNASLLCAASKASTITKTISTTHTRRSSIIWSERLRRSDSRPSSSRRSPAFKCGGTGLANRSSRRSRSGTTKSSSRHLRAEPSVFHTIK